MDWNNEMQDIRKDLGALRPAIADVSVAFGDLARAATAPGELDTKTKELIAVAIGMCVYMGGGPSLMYGAKALAAFDQFTDPKE